MTKRAPKPDEHQIVVRMPTELWDEARSRAKQEERSMAQLLRYVCRKYVAGDFDHPKPARRDIPSQRREP